MEKTTNKLFKNKSNVENKNRILVNHSFYKNVNKNLNDGYDSAFKIYDESVIPQIQTSNRNKNQRLPTNVSFTIEQNDSFHKFKDFDMSPRTKKKTVVDFKSSMTSLFQKERNHDQPKVDLLSKEGVLNFKLGLKEKKK